MNTPAFVLTDDISTVVPADLNGFFVGWSSPPTPEQHLSILHGSDIAVLARRVDDGRVLGFITAITDEVLTVYLPLLEVLPAFQRRGIGTALVRFILDRFDVYMFDAVADQDVVPFYERLGMSQGIAVSRRNYDAIATVPKTSHGKGA